MAYTEVTLNQNETNGQQIAVDQIAAIDFQRVKISVGTEGNATDVSTADPLPVVFSGNVTVVQPTGSNLHTVIDSGVITTITNVVHVDDNGGSITVDGTVAVSNFPSTQPVSGTVAVSNFPATQPISAVALPLPADAATQTTLALIKAKTDNIPALGQALAAASTPIVLTAAQITTLTPPTSVGITGTVTTSEAAPTTGLNNKKAVTTAGTRVQLQTNTIKAISVKALLANSGIIYVGDSGVSSSNGYELAAGDSVQLDCSNSNIWYIDSSVSGEGVSWIAVN